MAPSLLEIGESVGAFAVPRHPAVVEGDGFVFLPLGPSIGAVQRIRLDDDALERARDEVRALARERDLPEVGWWCSSLTQPADLGPRLGLEHRETLRVLALTRPFDGDDDFEVRVVATLDDYVAAQTIDSVANGWPTATREQYAEMWPIARDRFLVWLALDGDTPVGMARCAITEDALVMIGGSVLPEARGRGAYRSLVAARWQAAAKRRVPALVTAANSQSGPILERLGFEQLGEVEIWVDRV